MVTIAVVAEGSRPPQPVTKYWVAMPTVLETIQKIASPLANCRVNRPNIIGIIHNIILFIDCCLGSPPDIMVIFCCTHMLPPTRMGNTTFNGSGWPRFIHRKFSFRGTNF